MPARATPRQNIHAECERRGREAVVAGCISLLDGQGADEALIIALGGEAAPYVLSGGEGGPGGRWPRVWAARGLLRAWDEAATPAIIRATSDDAWRVREMAAKVVAKHKVGDAIEAVVALAEDHVPRVRTAASRAVMTLSASRA
ncbi:MAG TPA: HEAT repeat domain-containing protein [Streptosporangiaceae bacterium]|nr:HEAT repeat domain-containing protein [Streptosporangiaceae bacterium]